MPKCYIAGPMRGYPDFNFPAFDEAEKMLTESGWDCISPADMDREEGHPDDPNSTEAVRMYATRDLHAILSLRSGKGDAVIALPGWTKSRGATTEMMLGRWLNLFLLEFQSYDNPSGKVYSLRTVKDIEVSAVFDIGWMRG